MSGVDRLQVVSAEWIPEEQTVLLDGETLADVRGALEMVLDHPPPLAILRGWTPEERAEVKVWAWTWFDWSGGKIGGKEPVRPACLQRALDFLANGTITIQGGAT